MAQLIIDIPDADMDRVVAGLAVAYSYNPDSHGTDVAAYVRWSIADQLATMVVAVEKNHVVQTAVQQAGDITPPVITFPDETQWTPPDPSADVPVA